MTTAEETHKARLHRDNQAAIQRGRERAARALLAPQANVRDLQARWAPLLRQDPALPLLGPQAGVHDVFQGYGLPDHIPDGFIIGEDLYRDLNTDILYTLEGM